MSKVSDLFSPVARSLGLIFGLALGAGLSMSAQVQAQTRALDGMYVCDIKSLSGRGWIPPQISLRFYNEWSAEVVHLGNLSALAGRALKAGFFRLSESSYRVSWTISNSSVGNSAGAVETHYRAVFNTRNMKISVQVISAGMEPDSPRGIGRCEQITG
ncbi:hypothetical protein [Phaeobacter porticola]|uniref:Uncharacterized protein n=1 Tax=Phaeobacter porticola TaxID=1844006 RepID=A0A1L3I5G4_9RHOB|nr:hypothetical protein [Phaeobacter porticola]APG47356.1 hypothetical protein PhaeoP97_01948 [Phaeobacter porticola]